MKHSDWIFGPNFGMVDVIVGNGEQRPKVTRESKRPFVSDGLPTVSVLGGYIRQGDVGGCEVTTL